MFLCITTSFAATYFDLLRDQNRPHDLHALSTSPAFILSQDQTLIEFPEQNKRKITITIYLWITELSKTNHSRLVSRVSTSYTKGVKASTPITKGVNRANLGQKKKPQYCNVLHKLGLRESVLGPRKRKRESAKVETGRKSEVGNRNGKQ